PLARDKSRSVPGPAQRGAIRLRDKATVVSPPPKAAARTPRAPASLAKPGRLGNAPGRTILLVLLASCREGSQGQRSRRRECTCQPDRSFANDRQEKADHAAFQRNCPARVVPMKSRTVRRRGCRLVAPARSAGRSQNRCCRCTYCDRSIGPEIRSSK